MTNLTSKYFTIRELNLLNQPLPMGVIINLQLLVANVLDPLRRALNESIIITSGWRPQDYNQKIGGVKDSQHILGMAADFVLSPLIYGMQPSQLIVNKLMQNDIEFDQLILYHKFTHISYHAGHNRMQVIDKRALYQG